LKKKVDAIVRKERTNYKSRKRFFKRLWALWSIHIRLKYADWKENVQCFTCGKTLHWRQSHAGHYHHGVLDYDELNIHPQCAGCNTYRAGRLDQYALNLIRKYGADVLEELDRRKKDHFKKTHTPEMYQELYQTLYKKYGKYL
jgi:hypothetical protein